MSVISFHLTNTVINNSAKSQKNNFPSLKPGIPTGIWRSVPIRSQVVLFEKALFFTPLCFCFGAEKSAEKKQLKITNFHSVWIRNIDKIHIYINASPESSQHNLRFWASRINVRWQVFAFLSKKLLFYAKRWFPVPNLIFSGVSKPFWEKDFDTVSSSMFLTSHLSTTALSSDEIHVS